LPGAPPGKPPSVRAWAQRDYGNRVGIWRLMDVLSKHGIRASPTLNSDICDHHPQIVRAAVELGWEILGHNQTNSIWLDMLEPEEERQMIARTLSRIAEMTGRKPIGWLGSGLAETWHTLDFLAAEGCLYVADWVNDDQPYFMDVGGKRLVSIPYSYEINDSPHFNNRNGTIGEFEQMIRRQFDTLYAEGAQSGRVMAICLHPYLIGVPDASPVSMRRYSISALTTACGLPPARRSCGTGCSRARPSDRRALSSPAGGAVVDGLFESAIDLFGCHQRDCTGAHQPSRRCRDT
jgi:allantoinase